jgi:hypothetical protein
MGAHVIAQILCTINLQVALAALIKLSLLFMVFPHVGLEAIHLRMTKNTSS